MDWSLFTLLRSEIILTVLILIVLSLEIIYTGKDKNPLIIGITILFLVFTIIGFIPVGEGELFGGMYHTDRLTHFYKSILNVGVLIILFQSVSWLKGDGIKENKSSEFYLLLFSSLLGMNFLISAGDMLMFYLGMELSTLPLAALAAYELYKRRSTEAGIKLVLLAALSSAVALMGISLLYGSTGTLNFQELSTKLTGTSLETMATVFFLSGLAFKISLVPFHFWTADVYEGAPVPVTAYLSVISKGAAVFILMVVLYRVLPSMESIWKDFIYILTALTMTIGNLFALRQKNLKRFLAFSSVAQAGFILLGIIAGDIKGMTSVVYFVLIYVFSNLAAFGVIQSISNHTGKEKISDYEGLYRTNPLLSLTMMLALFSLAGIPPVAGFFGKFFLFMSAAGQGYYWLVVIAVVNIVISLYYYLLVIRAMFLRQSDTAIPKFKNDFWMRAGLVICVIGIISIGIYSPVYDYIYSLVSLY